LAGVPYVTHKPGVPLSRFVDHLWWLSDTPQHARERIVATGTQELVINLHDNAFDIRAAGDETHARRFLGAMVSGAYRSYFVIDTRAHASLLGVHFKPGRAGPVLGVPPGELADRHVDLEALWGATARKLRERLGDTNSIPERFRLLETALLARLAQPFRQHAAVPSATELLSQQGVSVGRVAAELCLSRRRLIELFSAEVGMTPKVFSRVQRFQQALARARAKTLEWPELALEAGYCDQSHLIRDFMAFGGSTPNELLGNLSPALKENHLPHCRG
jgi:AraC-like DNA-binding protein